MMTKRRAMADMNVIPYIDVMLVLLIIFMVTTPLMYYTVQVELPHVESQPFKGDDEQLPLIITVNAKGEYYLSARGDSDTQLKESDLVHHLLAEIKFAKEQNRPTPPLYVRGDKDAHYEKIVEALNLSKKAGYDKVGLMTQSHDA